MMVKPLSDKLVVKVEEPEAFTAGGIYLPNRKQRELGTVVAVGPGRVLDNGERAPVDVHVEDVVLFSKFGGSEVSIDGQDLLVLSSADILAVLI